MSLHARHRKHAKPQRAVVRRHRNRVYLVLSVVLLATAALTVGRYFEESPPPPAPAAALGTIPAAMTGQVAAPPPVLRDPQASTDLSGTLTLPPAPAPPPPPFSMKPSPPVSVRASAVGIDSALLQVGLNKDHSIEVPTSYDEAAWYRLGPTPGSLGPGVIVGHVDSVKGPGVFFNLGAMRPGQVIDVTRADKSVAHFRVDAINSYPKDLFPTEAVYGPINYAGLRLVTCGGAFDGKTKNYLSNIVVFASLIQP